MKYIFAVCIALSLFMVGCTENQRAKGWGGTANVSLPTGQKLFDVTWKGDNLWYAYRPMRDGEKPETYVFQEDSAWGVVEGKVVFKESR